jgi:probable addiction module antidote protein
MARRKPRFSRFDSADYLRSEQDIAAYVNAVLEEGGDDPAYVAHALGTAARAYGMVRLAKQTGITREGLYKALSKDGNPSFATISKVVRALGVRLTATAA